MHMIATRLQEGQDLKLTIEKLVKAMNLSAATVISGVGGLTEVSIGVAAKEAEWQGVRTLDGPFLIMSLTGNLGQGRTHLHISVADSEGNVTGGHLKAGSIVHATVEVVLAVEDKLVFGTAKDPKTGFGELEIS